MIRQLHQQDPDVFACVGLANIHIKNDELDEAEALLQPLASRKRFHDSEFDAFCKARIELYLAQKNPDATRSWLDMWAMTNPDIPALDYWRRRLDDAKRQTDLSVALCVERFWSKMK
jgi:hypothetical protein